MPMSDEEFQQLLGPAQAPAQPQQTAQPQAAQPHGMSDTEFQSLLKQPAQQPAAQQEPVHPVYSGAILPMTRYSDGSVGFDSNAGLVGDVKSVLTGLPWLTHQIGAETAANTATPAPAGQTAKIATMFTPGDMLAPGVSGVAKRAAVDIPKSEELYADANAAYDAGRGLNVHYTTDGVGQLAYGLQSGLDEDGIHGIVAPKTHAILSTLQNPGDAVSVPLTGLESARRLLGRISSSNPDPVERMAAGRAKSGISDFIENPPEEAVLAGPAADAGQLYTDARGNYAAVKRSDLIEGKDEAAEFQASSANSGRNYDNALRQKLRPLIDPQYPQRLSGFTPDERQAVTGLVQGSIPQNLLRTGGNMLGGGHGIAAAGLGMAGAAEGYHAAGIPGAVAGAMIPVAGSLMKTAENKLASRGVDKVAESLRARSPLYLQRQANAPFTVNPDAPGMAAVRAVSTPTGDDQPAYAKGGAVKKPTHEFLVQRLMKLAEKAKKAEKKVTAPILNLPDDTVTDALQRAQAAL